MIILMILFRGSNIITIITVIIIQMTILQISFCGSSPPRSPLPSMKGKHNNHQIWSCKPLLSSEPILLAFSILLILMSGQRSCSKFSLFPSLAIIATQSSILLSRLLFVTIIGSIVKSHLQLNYLPFQYFLIISIIAMSFLFHSITKCQFVIVQCYLFSEVGAP